MNDEILIHAAGCDCGAHASVEVTAFEVTTFINDKPVFALDQIIDQLTRSDRAWDGVGTNPVPRGGRGTITYGFFDFASQVYSSESSQFEPLSETQRAAVRLAFDLWEDLINIDFREGPVGSADINIGNIVTTEDHYSAYARFPGTQASAGDIWISTLAETNKEVAISDPGFRTILHEIGHALGISHPGNYNAEEGVDITYAANAEYYQDSYQYTIMSYFGSTNTGASRSSFASTPFLHDVAAIQSLYGANMTTRTGDTVYGFNSSADRSVFNFAINTAPVVTIWDAGGVDTLDFSGWSTASTIDLAEGGFSHGGGQTHNVAIAFGTLIENAVAGAGSDILTGNTASNFFYLQSGGADLVAGLAGGDGFYFGGAYDSQDRVDGGDGVDTLALQGRYVSLVMGEVTGVEVLLLASGSDTRFGRSSTDPTVYDITTIDGNVAAGAVLTVQAGDLRAGGEALRFNGSAETDGHFRVFAGRDVDDLTGGKGSDGFFFGGDLNLTGADRIRGGDGADSIALRGNHVGAGAVTFQDGSFDGVEVLVMLSGRTNEYGGFIVTDGFDYAVTMADGNVGAGQQINIVALTLGAGEDLLFDGRAETDGAYRLLSGAGNDIITSGAGNDYIYGGLGADRLYGGGGGDLFVYRGAAESRAASFDTLVGFDANVDRIDLAGDINGIAASLTDVTLSLATLGSDLAGLLADALGVGQAVSLLVTGGDLAGRLFVAADGNGIAGFQADGDYLFELLEPAAPIAPGPDFFI